MRILLIVLRILHIGLGVFWAGTVFFVVSFLEPTVRGAGPAGGAIMAGLQRRRFLNVLPAVGLLTILTGLTLYMLLWGGSGAATPAGMTLGVGGITAILALFVGWFFMRPAQLAAGRLGASLREMTEGPERLAAVADLDRLQRRVRRSARWVAILLAVTVVAMAVGRYA